MVQVCQTDAAGRLSADDVTVSTDGVSRVVAAQGRIVLSPGESVTLVPRLAHQFHAVDGPVLGGEVSSVNDDVTDNFFVEAAGRFPAIDEDEAARYLLCGEGV